MGKRRKESPKIDSGNNEHQSSDHQKACRNKKGKGEKPSLPENLGNILGKTVKRFAPFLKEYFSTLPEHRNKNKLYYEIPHFMWSGILIFLLLLESRKQYRLEKDTEQFLKNILMLSGTDEETAADPDTIGNFLEQLPSEELEKLPPLLVNHLIRIKALDDYRFRGHFLIAIDGTGIRTYSKRHCEHCLTKKSKNGQLTYYHYILEAKLVTQNGFAFSVATEFIKNPHEFPTKQDCEYNAFKRLAPKLYSFFPRLPICLLMDALYTNAPTFKSCEKYHWKYIITFKEGNLKTFYKEVWQEKQRKLANRKTIERSGIIQSFAWVNYIEYKDLLLNAIFCNEKNEKDKTINDFAWVTNFHELSEPNVDKIANEGGRLRWNIEESFNVQKNGGYELEHSYSQDNNASCNWYFLMQIAHALNQLMTKSNLFINFKKQMVSLRNFAKRLAEHLRFLLIDENVFTENFQIRFNSS